MCSPCFPLFLSVCFPLFSLLCSLPFVLSPLCSPLCSLTFVLSPLFSLQCFLSFVLSPLFSLFSFPFPVLFLFPFPFPFLFTRESVHCGCDEVRVTLHSWLILERSNSQAAPLTSCRDALTVCTVSTSRCMSKARRLVAGREVYWKTVCASGCANLAWVVPPLNWKQMQPSLSDRIRGA